jgi:cytochrome c oxidase subunit II
VLRIAALSAVSFALVACAGDASTLDPEGPRGASAARLLWVMTAIGAVVYALVLALTFIAVRRSSAGGAIVRAPSDTRLIVGGGIVLPAVVIPLLWVLTLSEIAATTAPPGTPTVTIEVTGQQWSYEVRYPEHAVTVENELHVPVGQTVALRITSADVIHSFWIPRLMGKIDMIPGRVNDYWVRADEPGRYPVVCAEFCGLWHARMRMEVIAEQPAEFERWIAERRAAR